MVTHILSLTPNLFTQILNDRYLDHVEMGQAPKGRHYKPQAALARLVCKRWRDAIGKRAEFYVITCPCSFLDHSGGWVMPLGISYANWLQNSPELCDVDVPIVPYRLVQSSSVSHYPQLRLAEFFQLIGKSKTRLRCFSVRGFSEEHWTPFLSNLKDVSSLELLYKEIFLWQDKDLLSQIVGFEAQWIRSSLHSIEGIYLKQPIHQLADVTSSANDASVSLHDVKHLRIKTNSHADNFYAFFTSPALLITNLRSLTITLHEEQDAENLLCNLPRIYLYQLHVLDIMATPSLLVGILDKLNSPSIWTLRLTTNDPSKVPSLNTCDSDGKRIVLQSVTEFSFSMATRSAQYDAYSPMMSYLSIPSVRKARIQLEDGTWRLPTFLNATWRETSPSLRCLEHLDLETTMANAIDILDSIDISHLQTLKLVDSHTGTKQNITWRHSIQRNNRVLLPNVTSFELVVKYAEVNDAPSRLFSYLQLPKLDKLSIKLPKSKVWTGAPGGISSSLPSLRKLHCEMSPYALSVFLQRTDAPMINDVDVIFTEYTGLADNLETEFNLRRLQFNLESLSMTEYRGAIGPSLLPKLFKQFSGSSLSHVGLAHCSNSWSQISKAQEERLLSITSVTVKVFSSEEWQVYGSQLPFLACLQALRIVVELSRDEDDSSLSLSPLYAPAEYDLSSTPLPALSTLQMIFRGKRGLGLNAQMELRELVMVRDKFGNRLKRLEVYPPATRFWEIFEECTDEFIQHEMEFALSEISSCTESTV